MGVGWQGSAGGCWEAAAPEPGASSSRPRPRGAEPRNRLGPASFPAGDRRGDPPRPHSHRLPGAAGTCRPRHLPGASLPGTAAAPNSAPPTPTLLGPGRSPAAAPRPPRQRRPRAFVRPRRERRAPPDEGRPGWGGSLNALHALRSRPPGSGGSVGRGTHPPRRPPSSLALHRWPRRRPRSPSGPPSGRGQPVRRAFRERRGARPGEGGARARAAHARCAQSPRRSLAVRG